MKRWQDRGEVQDSEDDEDLALSPSRSPERPHKRAKYDQSIETAGEDPKPSPLLNKHYGLDDEDKTAWLPAQVANTYGRKGKLTRLTRRTTRVPPAKSVESDSQQGLPQASIPGAEVPTTEVEPNLTSTFSVSAKAPSAICGHSGAPQGRRGDSGTAIDLPDTLTVRDENPSGERPTLAIIPDVREASTVHTEQPSRDGFTSTSLVCDELATTTLTSTPGSDGEDLPDVRDLFTTARRRTPSTTASSPLSEREVSPPAYFETHDHRGAQSRRSAISEELDDAEDIHDNTLRNSMLDDATFLEPSTARRSLRARKEIQLHPYLIDKAKYQRQCKERGIKPVRLVDVEPQHEQSEENHDSSQQSAAEPFSTQSVEPVDLLRGRPPAYVRLASAAEGSVDNHDGSGIERAANRRRVGEGRGRGARQDNIDATGAEMQYDGQSIPPSPPQTLSESSTPGTLTRPIIRTASGFRHPRCLSPAPLPTPHVSSDVRPTRIDGDILSGSVKKARRRLVQAHGDNVIDSGNDSDAQSASSDPEAESESELLARRLQREQKRIKGVLPASWLRIDFRAQKQPKSPVSMARRRHSTASPERHTPQRGIAKRLATNRPSYSDARGMALVLEDGAESDDSLQYSGAGTMQSRLALDDVRVHVAPSETVDDDNMEHDFVDAMLPGQYSRRRTIRPGSRQPRITDKLHRSTGRSDAISGDRKARQQGQRAPRDRHVKSAGKQQRGAPMLSIIDAYGSPARSDAAVPPFVRLALRQARRLPDEGRHSPSRKFIRLHTADETREATSVLHSWRAGTLTAQRKPIEHPRARLDEHAGAHSIPEDLTPTTKPRQPLREVTGNLTPDYGLNSASEKAASRQAAPSIIRRPRLRQSQLGVTRIRDGTRMSSGSVSIPRSRGRRERLQPTGLRAAQLETLQQEFDQGHRAAVFERRMQCLTETVAVRGRQGRPSDFQLSRYFQRRSSEVGNEPTAQAAFADASSTHPAATTNGEHRRVLTHRPRKRQAHRLDLGPVQQWQANEIDLDSYNDDTDPQPTTDISKPVLLGLGAFGTHYPIDFDMRPLPQGTYFRQDSLVGSGDLQDAVNLASCNLDCRRGQMSVHFNSDVVVWAAWNADVAADFRRIPAVIAYACQSLKTQSATDRDIGCAESGAQNIAYLLRSTVRYCSKCLFFVDPVDRQTCLDSLSRLIAGLAEVVSEGQAAGELSAEVVSVIMQYQLVLACQATQLSTHPSVSTVSRRELEDLLLNSAVSVGQHVLTSSFEVLRDWYREVQFGTSTMELTDNSLIAMTIVILNHTARTQKPLNIFWTAINASLAANVTIMRSVEELDKVWNGLFSILPALRINARGCVQDDPRSSHVRLEEDWTMVRDLISRVFELYKNTSLVRGFTVNAYIRSLLHRCHRLVDAWNWTRCDPILYTLYDFFSKQHRMLLEHEEPRGSFKTLEDLSTQPSLQILPNDLSFHVFLKTLATALIRMREQHVYNDRKIGASIAYRMIPTHGRTYPKEKDMQQDDVDALRNHHDLLCTLYYASPPGYRPGVDILRNLVDHTKWHRKACQLNVKAWAMLITFQASTYEPIRELQPLAAWFCDMLRSTTTQYRLARSEAEHDFHHARGVGADINESFMHATIANNQFQIASTLVDALAGLKRAFAVTTSIAGVQSLVQPTCFSSVFELYDPSQRRLLSAASETLYAVQAALDAESRLRRHAESQLSSTDSQDFGDFSALDELDAPDVEYSSPAVTTANSLLSPMSSFLSSIFGADTMPDDALLESSVRVWIRLASDLVNSHQRTWLSYVDEYSPNSWMQMRDTRQKRMFTPFYMSRMAEQPTLDEQVRQRILSSWLVSLVEREAMLRFQHVLTSTLLDHLEAESLLRNLPFARDMRSGRFMISLHDFRQRRLSLISSILSNMRQSLAELRNTSPAKVAIVKSTYAEMLRQLMQTMKSNYQELQSYQSVDVADESTQGAYVEFVQDVVSFLQQHTADFCQVDKFFTDSSAFPLPATDPTYVVGKLKGYALKLADLGPRTELAVFIQSVSERAAVDRQQQYLVNQLATAMCGDPEMGRSTAPTLRHVLLTTILPAYIDNALDSACGWILSVPLLRTCEVVAQDALYSFQVGDEAGVTATTATLISVLHSINGQCDKALARHNLAREPALLHLLAAMFNVCRASLTSSSCIQRQSSYGTELLMCLRAMYTQSSELEGQLNGSLLVHTLGSTLTNLTPACPWPDTKLFAEKQVRDSATYWYIVDGRYYLRRGTVSKEVEVQQFGSAEQERSRLLQDIACFRMAYEATFGPNRRQQRSCSHMSDLLI